MEISKLLVANRGEIAVRVFRTCRELGIATVAVVAPDDTGALHARSADETVAIAGYLTSEEHVRAAKRTGADAIHPGYGFLSENPDFAEAVEAAGLLFVGPSPDALRSGGDKLEAKRIAREAGVPVVPEGAPEEIGYPLVIKAAAGGGGRGMRVVRAAEELDDALAAAQREAEAAFGDDRVFCERYVERPRHVEIQLLADSHGVVIALGERECSIQRRHQKVLEESPSPALDAELRAEMSEAAVAFARAIGYRSAGTAEFMLSGRDFWFLELNGRIQVEHPVTEAVTGIDIVSEQIRLAQGGSLHHAPRPMLTGHAVEVRLYAEDPRTFLPQAGRIERLRLPGTIRVDAGVEEGDEVGVGYDPMIAKLIAHGETRDEALAHLRAALADTQVGGPHDQPAVPPLAGGSPGRPRRRDDDGVPRRLSASLGAAAPPRFRLASALAAEPARTGTSTAAGPRQRHTCPRCDVRREHGDGSDAGDCDPGPRRRRRPRRGATDPARAGGDEDGDAARLALRGRREGSPRRRGRPRRGRAAAPRARGVTPRRSSRTGSAEAAASFAFSPFCTRIPARIAKPAIATQSERSPHDGFTAMSKMSRKSTIRSARESAISRCIRAWTTGDVGPSVSASFASRPDSGPKKSEPARKVIANRSRPITIQSSPKPQNSLSITSKMPLTTASPEAGMNTRVPTHSTSCPNSAIRIGSVAFMILSAKNWIIAPPPTQIVAMATCANSRNSYQLTTVALLDQKSFWSFMAAPMSPLILSLPDM